MTLEEQRQAAITATETLQNDIDALVIERDEVTRKGDEAKAKAIAKRAELQQQITAKRAELAAQQKVLRAFPEPS